MSDWSPDDDARLIEMLAAGLSATQIGAALGRSRSAVIGRTHRLEHAGKTLIRVRGPLKPSGSRKYTARTIANRLPQPVVTPQKRATTGILSPAKVRAAPVLVVPPPPPPSTDNAVDILEVTGCRFPVSNDAPHRFCNHAKRHEDSYCEYHKARAYSAPVAARRTQRPVIAANSLRAG